jgi:hypothetical protein
MPPSGRSLRWGNRSHTRALASGASSWAGDGSARLGRFPTRLGLTHVETSRRSIPPNRPGMSWSSEFACPIWVGRLADPATRKGYKESLD